MPDALDRDVAILKTIADRTRLRILGLLAEDSRTGTQLAQSLGLSAATISHHMARLVEAGVVSVQPDAQRRVYSLAAPFTGDDARADAPPLVDDPFHHKTVATFFKDGRLTQIPAKRRARVAVLLELLRRFEPGRRYSEAEVNDLLRPAHDDVAFLRRELVDYRYLIRSDGVYQVATSPPVRDANEAQEVPAGETEWLRALITSAVRSAG